MPLSVARSHLLPVLRKNKTDRYLETPVDPARFLVLAFESRNPLVATSLDGSVHTVKHGWVGQDLRAALSKHNPTLGHPSTFTLMGKDGTAVRDTIDLREAKSMQNPGTFTLMFRSLSSANLQFDTGIRAHAHTLTLSPPYIYTSLYHNPLIHIQNTLIRSPSVLLCLFGFP